MIGIVIGDLASYKVVYNEEEPEWSQLYIRRPTTGIWSFIGYIEWEEDNGNSQNRGTKEASTVARNRGERSLD